MDGDGESIQRSDFPKVRRGYDPEQVDRHLARVAESVEQLRQRLEQRERELEESSSRLSSAPAERVRGIIEAAETSAEEMRQTAEQEAEQRRDESEGRARRTIQEAEQRARSTVEEAEQRARQVLAGSREALDRIAEALLERETLSAAELEAIIDDPLLASR